MDIENKTIIITGAARGLGAAMAKRLATHKCKLGLIDLEQESMNDIKEACEAVGAEVMTYAADVTREEDVTATFRKIVADLGPLHGAINNAGITRDALLVKFKDGKFEKKMSLEDFTDKYTSSFFIAYNSALSAKAKAFLKSCFFKN